MFIIQATGINVQNLFFVTDCMVKRARVFAPSNFVQASLIFVVKAESLIDECDSIMCSTQVGSVFEGK